MKCINRKKSVSREEEVRRQLFYIAVLSFLLLAGILALIFISKSKTIREFAPYDRDTRMFGSKEHELSLKAEGIADYLCVGASDTKLEGVESPDGELAGLFDIQNKKIPFSKGLYEQVSPGRLTQLMTVLTALDKLKMDDPVTIEKEDRIRGFGVIHAGLAEGNLLTVGQLIHAILVCSADDACLALARTVSGSTEDFAEQMNAKAHELGMTNTRYVNPTGHYDEEQYTTVYDVYLLLNAFLNSSDLINAMGLKSYILDYVTAKGTAKQRILNSNNPYIAETVSVPKDVTVLGGKSISYGDRNYTALLVQNKYGDPYAAVVMQTETVQTMYERMEQLLGKINQ